MPRTKKMLQCAVKFEAEEENRIVCESLFCFSFIFNIFFVLICIFWVKNRRILMQEIHAGKTMFRLQILSS